MQTKNIYIKNKQSNFATFFWRITASHMISYFVMGLIALQFLGYERLFETPPLSFLMKPIDSVWVAIGPSLQVFRGLIIALALWYYKDVFLGKPYGWLKLWGLLVGLSLLSTVGPTPGSIDGFIYTKIPLCDQLIGYIEVIPQTFLFSIMLFYWYEKPKKLWNIIAIICITLILLLGIAGALLPQ